MTSEATDGKLLLRNL